MATLSCGCVYEGRSGTYTTHCAEHRAFWIHTPAGDCRPAQDEQTDLS